MNPLTKRLAIVLAISLGINLLLGGFMLGRRFHGGPPPMASAHGRDFPLLRERMRMKHGMGDMRPEWRAFQKDHRAARERVARAFEHEPFDPGELDGALAALREQTTRGQKALHDELAQQAKSGDEKLRQNLARSFRRPAMHGPE
ncbi:MAG TPA: periplasmic heavy metal sensor [Polyangiaceae bacterium]|nr:periplasmic heavy metal sensor [Polyangiaceae bacterium]